jgi:RimJ/RimL family protein N-acetyltransferase
VAHRAAVPNGPSLTDGAVAIRASTPADSPVLIEGRDDESRRFLGEGDTDPAPTACITVGGRVVGWVDFDPDRPWLLAEEVNLGYNVFPAFRGCGYATRGVSLLLRYLADSTDWRVATLLIHPDNAASLALARRLAFTPHGDLDGNLSWKTPHSRFGSRATPKLPLGASSWTISRATCPCACGRPATMEARAQRGGHQRVDVVDELPSAEGDGACFASGGHAQRVRSPDTSTNRTRGRGRDPERSLQPRRDAKAQGGTDREAVASA